MTENYTVDPKDAEDNKVMAILAYFGILFLVPLLVAKTSPFARFHTNQGILLCIAGVAVGIVLNILVVIFAAISGLFVMLTGLLSIIFGLGIINAAKGEMKELPLIGKYRILN